MTDHQKSRVYDAEKQVRRMFDFAEEGGSRTVQVAGSTLTLPVERKFGTIASIQSYVDAVLALNWVRADYVSARIPVTVRERAGQSKAHYEQRTRTMAIPPRVIDRAWAMRELVVLHELAHHLAPFAQHGPIYAATFADLVHGVIGPEAGFLVRVMYASNGVSMSLKETV